MGRRACSAVQLCRVGHCSKVQDLEEKFAASFACGENRMVSRILLGVTAVAFPKIDDSLGAFHASIGYTKVIAFSPRENGVKESVAESLTRVG